MRTHWIRSFLVAVALSASGCGQAPAVAPDMSCLAGQTLCGATCIDTMNDPKSCGACEMACPADHACVAGHCALSCPGGLTACDDKTCANLQNDPANCGKCGMACPMGEVCSAAICALTCQASLTNCNGLCVNTMSDLANCGKCANPCASGNVCSAGACAVTCQSGLTSCGGTCVSLMTDSANCGLCGAACPQGKVCAMGQCAVTCQMGLTVCNGACANLQTDNANCGACGTACLMGQVCSMGACAVTCQPGLTVCNGGCANLQTDNFNCGACATVCPQGQTCQAGRCQASCNMPLVACMGLCVDTRFDPRNCSACGMACAAIANGVSGCNLGACTVGSCNKGFLDCDAQVANGCEVNIGSDAKNCGACGKTCKNTEGCCNQGCMDVMTDVANCGACGNACAMGQTCCSGSCIDKNKAGLCQECAKFCGSQAVAGQDFGKGTLGNLTSDMTGLATIRDAMAAPPKTPYVWVVMHDTSTANKFDVMTGQLLLKDIPTGGGNPSRGALALDGSFWIAHRCPSDPNNPKCSNVTQMQPDGSLRCIVSTAADGKPLPFNRALAIDANGFVWVGTWNDARIHKIDPVSCKVLFDIALPNEGMGSGNPYGFAIDSKGLLYTSTLGYGPFTVVDTNTGKIVKRIPNNYTTYGVAIDRKDNVYWGQWTPCAGGLFRYDALAGTLSAINPGQPGNGCTRGLTIDSDGNLWTAYWTANSPSYVSKFAGGTGAFLHTYALPSVNSGVGISGDAYGKVWITSGNYSGGGQSITRFNKDTGAAEVTTQMPGVNAYNYSDWNGYSLRTITTQNGQTGTWVNDFDGGGLATSWQSATWTAMIPNGASVAVRLRAAASQPALAKAAWCGPFNASPVDLTACKFGPNQWLESEARLTTNNQATPPVVANFTVFFQN